MYEPRYDQRDTHTGGFIMGLACGAALGAAVGLMCAPGRGAELRQQILDSTEPLRRQAAETYEQASKAIADLASQGREIFTRTAESFEGEGAQGPSGKGGAAFDDGPFQRT